MKLIEIISENNAGENSILIEELSKYKKQLCIYYNHYFSDEPILMVISVMNACQYAKIVPSRDFDDAICAYLDDYDCDNEDSERFGEYETICANSIALKDL